MKNQANLYDANTVFAVFYLAERFSPTPLTLTTLATYKACRMTMIRKLSEVALFSTNHRVMRVVCSV